MGLLIQARKLAPGSPDVEFEFASAAFQMSLLQDAVDGFQETLKQRKNDVLALYGLGRAYGGLGKLEEARRQFEQYVRLRPDDPSGYCSLAITLAALEHLQEARQQFAKSIALACRDWRLSMRTQVFLSVRFQLSPKSALQPCSDLTQKNVEIDIRCIRGQVCAIHAGRNSCGHTRYCLLC